MWIAYRFFCSASRWGCGSGSPSTLKAGRTHPPWGRLYYRQQPHFQHRSLVAGHGGPHPINYMGKAELFQKPHFRGAVPLYPRDPGGGGAKGTPARWRSVPNWWKTTMCWAFSPRGPAIK